MDRGYVDFKRPCLLHQTGAFFVTRAKSNIDAKRLYSAPSDCTNGIICNLTIALSAKALIWLELTLGSAQVGLAAARGAIRLQAPVDRPVPRTSCLDRQTYEPKHGCRAYQFESSPRTDIIFNPKSTVI